MIGDFILEAASINRGLKERPQSGLKGQLAARFTGSIYLKIFFRRIYLKNYIKRNF